MDATFEEVVKLAEQLEPEQQNLLIYRLRIKQMQEHASQPTRQSASHPNYAWIGQRGAEHLEGYHSPTREELIREVETLRKTPPRPGDSLLGKYANPNVPEMSEEAFHAQMHAIATEWEQKLDEFYSDNKPDW